MSKKSVLGLLGFFALIMLTPADGFAPTNSLSVIQSPIALEVCDHLPVEIIVRFDPKAKPETFRAMLNGHNITNKFVRFQDVARALVSKEDGLQVSTATRRHSLPRLNVIGTQIQGKNRQVDFDVRLFFVSLQQSDNHAPIAKAGPDQTALVGDTVTLDGSGSTDVDGDHLTHRWSLVEQPPQSTAWLSSPTAVKPTLFLDEPGSYTIALVVSDGQVDSASDTVVITTNNSPPTANAGPDQTALVGDTVTLNGSGSSDVDGDQLTFGWSFQNSPAGSFSTLKDSSTTTPRFLVDEPGSYTIALVVNDGKVASALDTVVITTENTRPSANAGPDQTVHVGSTVTLDGSGSQDVDGNPLTYRWSITATPGGSGAVIFDPTAEKPTFEADILGNYVGQLIVNDGTANSDPDTLVVSTENSKPVAVPVANQTVFVGDAVELDGSASSDADSDPLSYQWSLTTLPAGSLAVLSDPVAEKPDFVANVAGIYVAQLIVSDGYTPSDPKTVTITAEQRTVSVPDVVGMLRDEAEAAIRNRELTVGSISQQTSTTVPAGRVISQTPVAETVVDVGTAINLVVSSGPPLVSVPGVIGMTRDQAVATITGLGLVGSVTEVHSTTVPMTLVISQVPAAGESVILGSAVNLVVSLGPEMVLVPDVGGMAQADAATAITRAGLSVGAIAQDHHQSVPVGYVISQDPAAGVYVDIGSPVSLAISSGPAMVTVPDVVGKTQAEAQSDILAVSLTVGTIISSNSDNVPAGNVISQSPGAGTSVPPNTAVDLTVSLGPQGPPLPPDPATVAPLLDKSVVTSTHAASEFLYTGGNPIQTGVAQGTIEAKRAAVLRGQVTNRDGDPLPGVAITILNHPEYGRTLSRSDGMYDLAVNGGGVLTVKYEKGGYLKAQRQADVPWQDFVWLPDVTLVSFDIQAKAIDLSAPVLQTARGTPQSDAAGTRQATLLIPPGTTAQMILPGGGTQPLTGLNIRATEYTVGPNGPQAMPAPLPPNVGYTYCVELTADEAEQAGAVTVQFNQPLPYYVENFLGFPVGSIVPSGYYDRQKAAWVPSPNGRVIKIVSVTAELADLDLNSTAGADPSLYTSLGITDAERRQLATLYTIGQQLWRVPITHFTPYDLNWPAGLGVDSDATLPNQAPPDQKKPNCDPCKQKGSILECQSQVLGQEIPVTGSPFSLNYRSSHVSGRTEAYTLDIPLSGPSVPPSLGKIKLEVSVAGRLFKWNFTKELNLSHTFVWDGKDAYGRMVQGRQPVNVRIGYEYPAVYDAPKPLNSSFGSSADAITITTGPSARQNITLWQEWKGYVGTWLSLYQGLGGFSLDAHHFYDRKGGILFRGDGGEYNAEAIASQVATRFAGGVFEDGDSPSVNGIPALEAHLAPSGIAAGPDGSIYLIHHYMGIIHILGFPEPTVLKITPDGNISTLPGFPAPDDLGDIVENVALGPDGSVYVSDTTGMGYSVFRYDPVTQTATIVAGIPGSGGSGCEECPANTSRLYEPRGITVSQDGTLYIADTRNQVVRKVDVNGIITTVAGIMGQAGFSGDNGTASSARLNSPYGLALGPDGSLYIADSFNYRVRRVGPDGIITTVAGTGSQCGSIVNSYWEYICGDGGPASQAQLYMPSHISVGPEGSLFITDGARVRRVSPSGIISALLSDPAAPPSVTWRYGGEGGPPARLYFGSKQTAVGPDGSLYVSGGEGEGVVLKIHSPLKGLDFGDFIVPSQDGSELYVFNAAGRHDRTLNANTNSIIYKFYYDSEGRLIKADDAYGNQTLIERNGSAPTAIIGPFGQRTQLTVNGDGYLTSISDPGGQTTSFTYTAFGLMTGMTEPKGTAHAFTYGAGGRLATDKDPADNIQTLTRSEFDTGYSVVHSTAEGRQTTYRVERLSNGNERQTNTFPTGAITTNNLSTNGSETITFADGSTSIPSKTPDPRFGMQSPLYKTALKMPSNLEFKSESKRTVTLSDPSDLLSVQTITDETFFGDACPGCERIYRQTYSAADKKYTYTTAEWRKKEITVNDQGSITGIDFVLGDGYDRISIDPVTFTYNPQGFLSETVFGDPSQTFTSQTFNYDALGRVKTIANAAGETVGYGYDAANRVTAATSPLRNRYGFNYDANSNLTQITMPSSAAHSLAYNSLNLLSEYWPPGGAPSYAWTYNKDRDLTRMTLPGGRTIEMDYDDGGRMSQVLYPAEATVQVFYSDSTDRISWITRTPSSGTAWQQMDYTYDGSLLKSAAYSGIANGTYTYTYDNNYFLTRIGFVSGGDSVTIPITRDKDGLVTRYGDFNFDRETTLGLLTTIKDSGSGAHTLQINYTYDALGRLAGRVHQIKTTEFDEYGNPINKPIFSLQLTRDNTGRIIGKVDGIFIDDGDPEPVGKNLHDYAYDPDGQLITVKNGAGSILEQYTYDSNANRLSTSNATAHYDVQDRITSQGGFIYAHNDDGFMTQRGVETLVYSARGELLERTAVGNTVAYAYDGYGRRVGRKNGLENWSQYLYADPQKAYPVTATRDPDGVLTTYHYDDFGHLFAFQRGVDWYYVASDQVGSPRVVSDTFGNIIKTLDYDSYGVLIADSDPGFDLPIGFAGGISDRVTGLVRFGARDYDPVIGRWTAKDPILFAGGDSNLYRYVFNNPVSKFDRKGKSPQNESKNSDYLNKERMKQENQPYSEYFNKVGAMIEPILQPGGSRSSSHGRYSSQHDEYLCELRSYYKDRNVQKREEGMVPDKPPRYEPNREYPLAREPSPFEQLLQQIEDLKVKNWPEMR